MGIFRTNDPTQFDDIDGIVIDEQTPVSSVRGVSANLGILVGQFQRGDSALPVTPLGGIGDFQEKYGRSDYIGNKQLRNKAFGALKIIRVVAADAEVATLDVGGVLTVDALSSGDYGNNIEVVVDDAMMTGRFKVVISDKNVDAVLPVETYDNLLIEEVTSATFASSKLVKVTIVSNTAAPATMAATPLAGGSDGTVLDTDYEAAIALAEEERAGNVLFLDEYNAARNDFLKIHAGIANDKMVICALGVDDDADAAVLAADNLRDAAGQIILAWPWLETRINGVLEYTSPASWVASVFTQTSPHVALSFNENTKFLGGVTDIRYKVGRNVHAALDASGVLAVERDRDVGVVIKNAVTTQILNSQRVDILRRRMAFFLEDSIALFLKGYQNGVNAASKRNEVKSQILSFDTLLVRDGIVPGNEEVNGGDAVLVDVETLNTDAVIAQGMFKILYRRRIFSSMRYIVLQADIGTGVVVTDVSN